MVTKVQKWGNSQGVRLSKQLLSEVDIDVGDAVDIEVREGSVVLTPVHRVRGGHDLRALVRGISKDYAPPTREELDWGAPVGREVW